MAANKKDFFISYNGKDKGWAEWIAWQLEATGYSVVIQAWDFRPGDNFVMKMQEAAVQANRTLMVLSPNYLAAQFTQPEWAAAFVQDPTGAKGTLLPVRVAECELQGLLPTIVYIDLVGLEEADARKALLAGIPWGRAKPPTSPPFPSGQGQPGRQPPGFPESPLRKIRNRTRLLLKQPRAASLPDELAKQAGARSVEEMLVPQQTDSLIHSLDTLHEATKRLDQPIPLTGNGQLRIRTDRQELTLDGIERPEWAEVIGRDEYGLYADCRIRNRSDPPPQPSPTRGEGVIAKQLLSVSPLPLWEGVRGRGVNAYPYSGRCSTSALDYAGGIHDGVTGK